MGEQLAAFKEWLKQKLTLASDLIILNFLFILCSIPVITLGAAEAACYMSLIRILRGEKIGFSLKGFISDFKGCFKKATLGWLLEIICLALLAGDIWFAVFYSEPDNMFFLIFSCLLAVVVLLTSVWFYPLVARFENKLGAHIKNSMLMTLARLPRTLLAMLMQTAVIAVPLLIFDVFAFIGWFWILFGASMPLYFTAKLLRKDLQCEPAAEKEMQES